MRMLGWMSYQSSKDRIYIYIWVRFEVAPIESKMRYTCLSWFRHVKEAYDATLRKVIV